MAGTLDPDLLKALAGVVDAGGFTRAAERLHLTQSTVSQQVRKLEAAVGRQLLIRERSGGIRPTEEGEILIGYARRILALTAEAQEAMRWPAAPRTVRLGVPEDFAGRRLIALLSAFARAEPQIRLDTASGWSRELRRRLDSGEVDLALVKREPGDGASQAAWPERLAWVAGRGAPLDGDPVPLALFPPGCIYRARVIDALERRGRRWRIAFSSQGLMGVQAAVASGLGISLLAEDAVLEDHRRLTRDDGFDEQPPSEIALLAGAARTTAPVRRVAEFLMENIGAAQSRPATTAA
ncbi:LysR family transcriptional regulator [Arenibaculum pallidiluteum]|uniref:LysR family transcriptional regulator n=1 Tax=Arenibaculum pallidiluteum TaxID=2812559 RepID=UPI001A973493|nr:LysR family transcriptional regulator [Arenibaculum pallidiluteum]